MRVAYLLKSPRLLRLLIFSALAIAALVSWSFQLQGFNNERLVAATSNFETDKLIYCLDTTPTLSGKENLFAGTSPRYFARVSVGYPLNSKGLLVGELHGQQRGGCFRATLRLSPGFERSKIFFVAKLQGKAHEVSASSIPMADGLLGSAWGSWVSSGSWVPWLRGRFLSSLVGVTPDSGGLVAGLSIGDTSRLSAGLLTNFKTLSLTHLTAVSGTNCAIVLGLVWFVSSRLRVWRWALTQWPRLLLSVCVLLGYVALVGDQPSVLRAGVMTVAVLLAKTLGRGADALNALFLACLCLLIYDPWMLFDYGFWLSALACVGILIVAPKLAIVLEQRFTRAPKWLLLAISVSFAAQLLCFPVLLLLQPGFSTYSIIANLLAEPMVLPVTVLGLIAVVAAAFSPWLTGLVSFTASIFAWLITLISDFFSELPFETGFWPAGLVGVLLAVCLATGAMGLAEGKLRRLSAFALAMTLVIAASCWAASQTRLMVWASGDWFVVSCDVGQGDATVIRSAGKVALIDVGREPQPIEKCLSELGIKHIDLLELTHFDLDHVGGLSGAIGGRTVGMALLTPFHDTRPGADDARDILDARDVPVVLAETGMRGRLGSFSWQVLSPHAGAPEAEDSNDGSITMLWRSKTVDIITLADLGEKGQMRLADEKASWMNAQLAEVPLVMKVSHHGSADQYPELIEALHPSVALVSVGKNNGYGHPTVRTLALLNQVGAAVARTDEHGSISVALQQGGLALGFQGEQGKTG